MQVGWHKLERIFSLIRDRSFEVGNLFRIQDNELYGTDTLGDTFHDSILRRYALFVVPQFKGLNEESIHVLVIRNHDVLVPVAEA